MVTVGLPAAWVWVLGFFALEELEMKLLSLNPKAGYRGCGRRHWAGPGALLD